MNTEKFDVIVIGAGLGGLTAAGYLAKAGKKVLILEHHTVPGGYAHEFRRGKYRFEVALHALDGAAPGGWAYEALSNLEVFDQVNFQRMDPFYTVRFGEEEFKAAADPMAYEAELISHFPDEAKGIRSLINAMMDVFWDVRRFMEDGRFNRRPPLAKIPTNYPHMLGAMGESWGDFMNRHTENPQLQGVVSTLWAYYGLPPSQLNAATFIFPWVSYHLFGAYYPEGGSMAMSRALETTIKKYGGDVRFRQTVTEIEIVDGRATAVITEKGLRAEADLIISNANAPDTMLKFVGRDHLPAGYIAQVEEALATPALGSVVVYLGLERDLLAEGWPHHELFIADGYDVEAEFEAVMDGRFEDVGVVISHYDQADNCSPEGGSVVTLTALASWDYADQWGTGGNLDGYRKNPHYLELKQAAGDALIDRAEKAIPGLRKSIKYVEVATPLTNHRYSRNPGGSIYGSAQTVDNMYINRLNEKTPIPNLFLAGAWVNGGGMSAAILSGHNVARKAQAQMDGETAVDLFAVEMDSSPDDTPSPAPIPPATVELTVPDVTLTAVSSQRAISLTHIGQPAVLIFHTQDTAAAANAVNQAVRSRYPLASQLMIASVVDLHAVPKMFRKFADSAMRKSYKKAEATLPAGMKAEEYVIILPDWDGGMTAEFGLENVGETAVVLVLNQEGQAIGHQQGDDLAVATMEMLATVMDN